MFRQKGIYFCLISMIFILTILLELNDSLAAEKKVLTWGSTSSSSGSFTYFVLTAKILNEKIPEINITVRSTGAALHNAQLIEKREIDIGLIDSRTAVELAQGKGPFEGKALPDLRLLYVFHLTNPLQLVVSEKSGIKDVYGLEGKPFHPGIPGSAAEQISIAVLRTLGVHPKLSRSSWADVAENLQNDAIVGFGKLGIPDATILSVMAVMKIKIISFSNADIEKILKNVYGLGKIAIPSGTYSGIGEINTVENQICMFVRKEFPEEVAYKIVKTVWENRAEVKKAYPQFIGDKLVEITTKPTLPVYLHPGVIRFCRESGYTVQKINVPPEMGGQ